MVKYKRIPLETLVNVRDLGGFAAIDGKITRYGVFLRSDCPAGISENDIGFLREYGITLSIDLRGSDEIKHLPSNLSGVRGHTYIKCSISMEPPITKPDSEHGMPTMPPGGNFDLGDSYIEIAETAKGWSKNVFELCADWDGGVLYHCFIGKDRVGIITALILGACGVGDTDIMMDYSASMSCLRPRYNTMNPLLQPQKRGRPDFSWGFFGSVPESMEALLCHINEKYGGVSEYLKDCGVSDGTVARMREKLLEDAV